MVLPKPADALHQTWLYRILSAVSDDAFLVSQLRFKRGTCAAMRGHIDRFSVDLDFDLLDGALTSKTQAHFEKIFRSLELKVKDKSRNIPQYFLAYPAEENQRNTVKIDMAFPVPESNDYEPVRFIDIDRILYCQTIETAFAHKLIAMTERYKKKEAVAGRDVFDIHTFFLKGYRYKEKIIEERLEISVAEYFSALLQFMRDRVTQTIIDQDLNTLLPPAQFKKIRKILKQETLMLLRTELARIKE